MNEGDLLELAVGMENLYYSIVRSEREDYFPAYVTGTLRFNI